MSIALKSTRVNWREMASRRIAAARAAFFILGKTVFRVAFYVCFVISIFALYFYPSFVNAMIVGLYAVMAVYNWFMETKKYGLITNRFGKPLPFTMVGIYSPDQPDRRLAYAVSDVLGRYFVLAKRGKYLVKMQGKELEGRTFRKSFYAQSVSGALHPDVYVESSDYVA